MHLAQQEEELLQRQELLIKKQVKNNGYFHPREYRQKVLLLSIVLDQGTKNTIPTVQEYAVCIP